MDEPKQKYTIFHRDIKLNDICLDDNFTAKLIDCGLAKFDVVKGGAGVEPNISLAQSLLHTQAHHVMGTSGYICPEYASGLTEYRAECDVYSFGVVMLEFMTGSLNQNNVGMVAKYNAHE